MKITRKIICALVLLCIFGCETTKETENEAEIVAGGGIVTITAEELGLKPIDFLIGQEEPYVVFEGVNGKTTAKPNIHFDTDQIIYDDGNVGIVGGMYHTNDFSDDVPYCDLYKEYKNLQRIYFDIGKPRYNNGELELDFDGMDELSNGDTVMLVISSFMATDVLKMNGYAPKYNYIEYKVENRPESIISSDEINVNSVIDFFDKEIKLPEDLTLDVADIHKSEHYSNLKVDSIYMHNKEKTVIEPAKTIISIYYSYDWSYKASNSYFDDAGTIYMCCEIENPYFDDELKCENYYCFEIESEEDIINYSDEYSTVKLY